MHECGCVRSTRSQRTVSPIMQHAADTTQTMRSHFRQATHLDLYASAQKGVYSWRQAIHLARQPRRACTANWRGASNALGLVRVSPEGRVQLERETELVGERGKAVRKETRRVGRVPVNNTLHVAKVERALVPASETRVCSSEMAWLTTRTHCTLPK
jgi:hypothetical protein